MVIGSVDLPSLLIFVHTFQNAHYTPKVMIAASGPDQGQAFLNTLNPINAQASWSRTPGPAVEPNALSHVMVQDYIAKFGGTSVRHQRRRRRGVLGRRGPGRRGHRDARH